MELVNRTPIGGARFLSTVFGEDRMLGAVVARPMFRVEDERLVPLPDESWPVDPAPTETPYGTLPPDTPFLSGGIDVLVMGSVHAPAGQAAEELRVDVRVGDRFARSLRVVGDRRWVREPGWGLPSEEPGLVPSDPEPFDSMPLAWDRAFGGVAEAEGMQFAYPPNPGGRGLYLTAEQAEGNPLPNLERWEQPIRSFADQPLPVGTAPYPADGSLRPTNAVDVHVDEGVPENSHIRRIKPLHFNAAAPEMIIPPADAPRPREWVEVTHASPEGPLRFPYRSIPLHVHVQLEDREWVFPLHMDQVGILTDERRVFFSYRTAFTYRVVPLERRRVTLHVGELPEDIPDHYRIRWED